MENEEKGRSFIFHREPHGLWRVGNDGTEVIKSEEKQKVRWELRTKETDPKTYFERKIKGQ